jgi:hypothetical protein
MMGERGGNIRSTFLAGWNWIPSAGYTYSPSISALVLLAYLSANLTTASISYYIHTAQTQYALSPSSSPALLCSI